MTADPKKAAGAVKEMKGGKEGPGAAKKSARTSPRRRAREFALQGLYQWTVGGADEAAIEAYMHDVAGFEKADRTLFLELLRGIRAQHDELRAALAEQLDRPFEELSPVEANILCIGAFELLRHPQTPYRVIINEAIELAKSYGGTDGHKYVNGVLDRLAAKLRPVEISGRGGQ